MMKNLSVSVMMQETDLSMRSLQDSLETLKTDEDEEEEAFASVSYFLR